MKGRHFCVIIIGIMGAVCIFIPSSLIKAIAILTGILFLGIYIGIVMKTIEMNYLDKKHSKDDGFDASLKLE